MTTNELPEYRESYDHDAAVYPGKFITHVFGEGELDRWGKVFTELRLNAFETRAMRGLLEELRLLLECRDAIDRLRDEMPMGPIGRNVPTPAQRVRLYALTKSYFDNFYSSTSHLASVVVRFSGIFGSRSLGENARTLTWARDNLENVGHDGYVDLERSRLFRTVLNHPQQFPTLQWDTVTRSANTNPHIMLYGPQSRSGKIPPGATRDKTYGGELRDWIMYAPDEVSVTNCLANAVSDCMFRIVEERYPGMHFRSPRARRELAWSLLVDPA